MSEKSVRGGQTVPPFSVGERVFVRFGNKKQSALIVEDRGRIGRNGRRLLRVAVELSAEAPEQIFEIPADDVTRQPRNRKARTNAAAK